MELKRLITYFTYRIEPKPEGGFIAHATDPTVPPLEAPSREELQGKIQANIAAGLASEFPGLKLPVEKQQLKFAFHIEHKPGGGLAIHSADPSAQPIEGATQEVIESQFAEKLITFVGKHFMPELSQALAAQGSGDIKVFVNRKTGFTVNAGSMRTDDATIEDGRLGDTTTANARFGSAGDAINNSPITPETSSSWTIFRFLLSLLIIGAMMYFFLHR
jgi:hypothetical protein